jgi:hypothetical protein
MTAGEAELEDAFGLHLADGVHSGLEAKMISSRPAVGACARGKKWFWLSRTGCASPRRVPLTCKHVPLPTDASKFMSLKSRGMNALLAIGTVP